MRQRAEIKVGSEVSWKASIRPELDYVALVDAKVVQLYPASDLGEAMAEIAVAKDRTITAPIVQFEVPLSELESKTWERDEEASAAYERDRFAKAAIVSESECQGLIEPDGETVCESVFDYLDTCECDDREPSSYLWAVKFQPLKQKDADDFVVTSLIKLEKRMPTTWKG